MKPLVASLFAAGIALGVHAAEGGETIAVLDLRSRAHPIVAAEVSDRVRETVRRMLPDARIVDRESDGDFVLTGRVSHGGLGYRAWLELRDRNGDVVLKASATASTRRELVEAAEGAAADLLRSRQEASGALGLGTAPLPAVPASSEPAQDALNLDADSRVLVAYDRARRIEAHGRDAPEDAAAAWRRVANMPGQNPFREMALSRAQQWEAYAAGRRAVDAQLAGDSARLRRVLPLGSLTDSAKIELLVRFAALHGYDKVSPFVALLPSALRERAELSLDCEVREAHACLQLARAADEAKDAKGAQEFLDRACAAGSADACAEAGDRWLSGDARDPARGVAALQRGCDSSNAAACVRLARMYEEGDGTAPSAKAGADLREKACAAGDGKSCRRLAGMSDEPGRIADLLRKGCDGGDGVSCALASREPAIVQRQLQEAAAAATKAASTVKPAKATETAPAKPAPSSPKTEVEPQPRDRSAVGAALIAFGAIAGTAALMMTDDGDGRRSSRSDRNLTAGSQGSGTSGRTVLGVAIGSAAVLSTVAGLAVLLSKPDAPEGTKVAVGVSPAGVAVSGRFP
jgi:TPR repeat protein